MPAVRAGSEADVAERSSASRARRRRAAAAGIDPDAAHFERAVVELGDRAHRCGAVDADAQLDLVDRHPVFELHRRGDRRGIVIDDQAHLPDLAGGLRTESDRHRSCRRIGRARRRGETHELFVDLADFLVAVVRRAQSMPGAARRRRRHVGKRRGRERQKDSHRQKSDLHRCHITDCRRLKIE